MRLSLVLFIYKKKLKSWGFVEYTYFFYNLFSWKLAFPFLYYFSLRVFKAQTQYTDLLKRHCLSVLKGQIQRSNLLKCYKYFIIFSIA